MKTEQQINAARSRLCVRLQTPGLNDVQKSLVMGMLNALIWAADGAHSETMDRMLSDEPIAPGKDPTPGLERMEAAVGTPSAYTCPKCGQPMAHSRLRGLFCMYCR